MAGDTANGTAGVPRHGVRTAASEDSVAFERANLREFLTKKGHAVHAADGWTVTVMTRMSGQVDKYYFSPAGKRFNSRLKVHRYLADARGDMGEWDIAADESVEEEDVEEHHDAPVALPRLPRAFGKLTVGSFGSQTLTVGEKPSASHAASEDSANVDVELTKLREFLTENGHGAHAADGWKVTIRSIASGRTYKVFTSPNGRQLFSMPQVHRHLANVHGDVGEQRTAADEGEEDGAEDNHGGPGSLPPLGTYRSFIQTTIQAGITRRSEIIERVLRRVLVAHATVACA